MSCCHLLKLWLVYCSHLVHPAAVQQLLKAQQQLLQRQGSEAVRQGRGGITGPLAVSSRLQVLCTAA
jgi:hypothetical protein